MVRYSRFSIACAAIATLSLAGTPAAACAEAARGVGSSAAAAGVAASDSVAIAAQAMENLE